MGIHYHKKIDKSRLMRMRKHCFDYYKNSDGNMRARYIFLFNDQDGFELVEENTEGIFIEVIEASISEAFGYLNRT